MKRIIERLKKNTLTQLIIIGMGIFIFGILANYYEWSYSVMVVLCFILAGYVIVFNVYGIINYIRDKFDG